MARQKVIEIGDMVYFKLDDLGECQACGLEADSYNEDGDLLCEECLIEWHENEREDLTNY